MNNNNNNTNNTVNALYIDTRYNGKIRYNDNVTSTKTSLKRWQLISKYAKPLYL